MGRHADRWGALCPWRGAAAGQDKDRIGKERGLKGDIESSALPKVAGGLVCLAHLEAGNVVLGHALGVVRVLGLLPGIHAAGLAGRIECGPRSSHRVAWRGWSC